MNPIGRVMIYDLTNDFPFDKVKCLKPTLTHNAFTIKLEINDYPLYVKFPACNLKTRIKVSKKTTTDLQFSSAVPNLVDWMERLEEVSQRQICENNKIWFDPALDESEIDNYFVQALKLYKSGRFYLLRVAVPDNLPVYNDSGDNRLNLEDLTEEMEFGTVLEFKGLRCTTKSFQLEVEVKQIRLRKTISFDTCIINAPLPLVNTAPLPLVNTAPLPLVNTAPLPLVNTAPLPLVNTAPLPLVNTVPSVNDETLTKSEVKVVTIDSEKPTQIDEDITKPIIINLEDLATDNTNSVSILNRKDIHQQMYRDAKNKAKQMKQQALSAYLSAQHIKTEFMLNDTDSE